ncbi:unnamed protein product [Darwinula stevensoni]|uniref:Uncharacterized protein n=1 Tax=Darwinula stevensoni TaxID=69355 RepID=A0A7R8XGM7_9CRUS|nr:unnamed protein product [Darwinula stevensoni]CAG0891622.1 unnamed protein product [Darwinula stevensoni]
MYEVEGEEVEGGTVPLQELLNPHTHLLLLTVPATFDVQALRGLAFSATESTDLGGDMAIVPTRSVSGLHLCGTDADSGELAVVPAPPLKVFRMQLVSGKRPLPVLVGTTEPHAFPENVARRHPLLGPDYEGILRGVQGPSPTKRLKKKKKKKKASDVR